MKALEEGDKVYCLDTTPDYGWLDHPQEEIYLDEHINAIKRGVDVYRVIMASQGKKDKVLQNRLIKMTLDNSLDAKYIGIVKEEDVKKYNKNDYYKIGKGFEIFIAKDGTKQLFIDSFISEESMGYVVENEVMIESLIEVFENIYKNIENKKIEEYK